MLLTLCEGNPPVTGPVPSQSPVTQSFGVFWSEPVQTQTVEETMETQVIWYAIMLIMMSL